MVVRYLAVRPGRTPYGAWKLSGSGFPRHGTKRKDLESLIRGVPRHLADACSRFASVRSEVILAISRDHPPPVQNSVNASDLARRRPPDPQAASSRFALRCPSSRTTCNVRQIEAQLLPTLPRANCLVSSVCLSPVCRRLRSESASPYPPAE